jgi:hypothetical protein
MDLFIFEVLFCILHICIIVNIVIFTLLLRSKVNDSVVASVPKENPFLQQRIWYSSSWNKLRGRKVKSCNSLEQYK